MAAGSDQPILIKKIKKGGGGGHHGGAWKVAYADFVTAMMAFFLLMWLINTTSPEQKRGIADYFAPASVSETSSGAGGILAGSALGSDGSKSSGSSAVIEELAPSSQNPNDGDSSEGSKAQAPADPDIDADLKREEAAFHSAAQSLRQALQDMPELAELSKNIIIDETPEGMRIQLVDQEGRSMFAPNSVQPNDRAKLLLRAISKVINQLPNRISLYGHTSANSDGSRPESDWQLSAGRANASRQVLQSAGVDPDRIYQVSGKAGSEPLYPDDPTLPGNRRLAIVLLREAPVLPPNPAL